MSIINLNVGIRGSGRKAKVVPIKIPVAKMPDHSSPIYAASVAHVHVNQPKPVEQSKPTVLKGALRELPVEEHVEPVTETKEDIEPDPESPEEHFGPDSSSE